VAAEDTANAVELLADRHPGSAVIGHVSDRAGLLQVPELGIEGDRDGLRMT
jgi:hypothetical protein